MPSPISGRTIALLAGVFSNGAGPSRSAIELVWTNADAVDYLGDGNKLDAVMGGLRFLRDGKPAAGLPSDHDKLRTVVEALAILLLARGQIDEAALDAALSRDGLSLDGGHLAEVTPSSEPSDRLAAHAAGLFAADPRFSVAKRHYELAKSAFERREWESSNAQLRSAFDATYESLADRHGCPPGRSGGGARKWLFENGHLDATESSLLKAFAAFAGEDGSHAGLSDATDAQLRRHFATALITFGIAKLG